MDEMHAPMILIEHGQSDKIDPDPNQRKHGVIMSKIQSVCVYCGADAGSNPAFKEAAENFGRMLAKNKIQMVFGGGWDGLMGITARAAVQAGAHVKGIMPHFLSHLAEATCNEIVFTKSMHERKQRMFDDSDAFVALPGGIGTLEELAEQLKWIQLGQHSKPVFLLNIEDYWTPFLELLEHMKTYNFLKGNVDAILHVCTSVDEIERTIEHLNSAHLLPHSQI
ncbi:MAG TPA: TIGR00730 family Rossman fold protein [Pseudorhodoplanes sp.]|nr:TIGR00730 family Rossman fold protein [Pseudorhodoplanes sp.]